MKNIYLIKYHSTTRRTGRTIEDIKSSVKNNDIYL